MIQTITVNDAVRNFSELLNSIRHESLDALIAGRKK